MSAHRLLNYLPPYDWTTLLAHLAARAVQGVEEVRDGSYRRTVAAGGTVAVRHEAERQCLSVQFEAVSEANRPDALARLRRVFDLDADLAPITAHLAQDPTLAPLLARRPGLRVPGGWDGFELAIKAVLGQQVTLGAGKRLTERLVALCAGNEAASTPLSRTFPTAEEVLQAELDALGMPGARRATLRALAQAALEQPELFRTPRGSIEETVAGLCAIRGVGDWTAHYIALRGLREPDAFPASDIGLLRGATGADGVRPTPDQLRRRAERWRPWRAYAAQHLWAEDAAAEKTANRTS